MNGKENNLKYKPEQPGHYEVWYMTLNDPVSGEGFWLRYTITSCRNPEESVAGVWAISFDPQDYRKNLALKENYPLSDLKYEKDDFYLKIGESYLTSSGAVGRVKSNGHEISWELCYDPSEETYFHFPEKLYNMKPISSLVCSPNLDVRMSGKITINGREFKLDGAPGGQTHIWGRKHADTWAWAHISDFDGESDTVFEGLSAKMAPLGLEGPALTTICLKHNGEEFKFNKVKDIITTRSTFDLGIWEFTAKNSDTLLRGMITANPKDLIGVTYSDPDGEKSYCYNSELADAFIDVYKKTGKSDWELTETLISKRKAAAEFAFRHQARGMEVSL